MTTSRLGIAVPVHCGRRPPELSAQHRPLRLSGCAWPAPTTKATSWLRGTGRVGHWSSRRKPKQMNLASYVQEAESEAGNYATRRGLPAYDVDWCAVIKRRNHPVGKAYVVMTLDHFLGLIPDDAHPIPQGGRGVPPAKEHPDWTYLQIGKAVKCERRTRKSLAEQPGQVSS